MPGDVWSLQPPAAAEVVHMGSSLPLLNPTSWSRSHRPFERVPRFHQFHRFCRSYGGARLCRYCSGPAFQLALWCQHKFRQSFSSFLPATGGGFIRRGLWRHHVHDAHNGRLRLRIYLPEPFAMLYEYGWICTGAP
jgi:hypothetical protein